MTDAAFARRLALTFALTLLFCAVSYVWLDRPVALWFKANLVGDWSDYFHRLTRLGLGSVWLIPSGLAAILFRWRSLGGIESGDWEAPRRRGSRLAPLASAPWHWMSKLIGGDAEAARIRANAALFLFVSVAGSGIAVDVLKGLIGRLRPEELFARGVYGFDPFTIHWAMNSFPSGHGQTAIAGATALALFWPRLRLLLLALGALVAASRVVVSVHYLSDVAMGAWFGAAGTALLGRLFAARGWPIRLDGGG